MKSKYILFYLFIFSTFYGQEKIDFITVKYNTFLLDESDDFGCFYYEENTLITDNEKSIYFEMPKDTIINTLSLGDLDNHNANYKFQYYKDFKTKQLLFDRNYGSKKIISDSTNLIDWKLNDKFLDVMNYRCQEAEGNFRGRNYKAYFLNDIPFKSGPFKFDGLPGLILKIVSTDGTVNIEAYEIEYSMNVKNEIKNPFIDKKTISWIEFKDFYKKRYDKFSAYIPDDGVQMSIPKGYIEKFID